MAKPGNRSSGSNNAQLSCPKDSKPMRLTMRCKAGSSKGPMYWICDCGHQQLKVKSNTSRQ